MGGASQTALPPEVHYFCITAQSVQSVLFYLYHSLPVITVFHLLMNYNLFYGFISRFNVVEHSRGHSQVHILYTQRKQHHIIEGTHSITEIESAYIKIL